MNEIPYEWGTAVNVQQMAFGNSGDRSGTGLSLIHIWVRAAAPLGVPANRVTA